MGKKQLFAFTLSETLITLMIIGILSVLVLPSVITNIQDNVFKERSRNILYKISQATDLMKVNGLLDQKYASTDAFVDELQNYLKISTRCNATNISSCFSSNRIATENDKEILTSNLKDGQRLGHNSWKSNNVGLILVDGTILILSYNSDNCVPMAEGAQILQDSNTLASNTLGCLAILYDTNSSSGPNVINKDIKLYNAYISNSGFRVGNSHMYLASPSTPAPLTMEECEAKKAQYGLTCSESTLYWAAAKVYCESNNMRLPKKEDTLAIASQLYNMNITTWPSWNKEPVPTIIDTELANFLGTNNSRYLTNTAPVKASGIDYSNGIIIDKKLGFCVFCNTGTQNPSFCVEDN